MKKFVLLILVLVSVFLVAGCMNKDEMCIQQVEDSASINDNDLSNDISVEPQNGDKDKRDNAVQDISEFAPEGWEVLKKYDELAIAEGDLNKDGILDKAFVIEQNNQSECAPPRNLLIAFGNEDNTYELSIMAEKAILLADEGGTFGDPFEDIIIDRGSVVLKFIGGSRSRWHRYFRFRYQDNVWYLIGFTEGAYDTMGDESMVCLQDDYNLITGDYIGEKLEDGKVITIKENIGKKQLLNLKDFVADEYSVDMPECL